MMLSGARGGAWLKKRSPEELADRLQVGWEETEAVEAGLQKQANENSLVSGRKLKDVDLDNAFSFAMPTPCSKRLFAGCLLPTGRRHSDWKSQ
ncbi:hypothetical protein NDU88_004821 [Pleurodeles waltl]|uniref:Uncharacterized protein n=1 Tax=Pleurodeles waltl TaxID=8319 RepID=A0AAV7QDC7_PLEWA|nr:hypothetical protein NDU88_004821 [Pleurodeles waltl]